MISIIQGFWDDLAYVAKVSCSSSISNFELGDLASNFLDNTDTFMAEGSTMWDKVDICSAETGVRDLDENLLRSQFRRNLEWDLLHNTLDASKNIALDCHCGLLEVDARSKMG